MSRARNVADFIPPGGKRGYTLVKASVTDYDTEWIEPENSLPPVIPGADQGAILIVDGTGQPQWGGTADNASNIIDGGAFS